MLEYSEDGVDGEVGREIRADEVERRWKGGQEYHDTERWSHRMRMDLYGRIFQMI